MYQEKRTGQRPIPENIKELMNDIQMRTLRQLEGFGWRLGFIRRPLFQQPMPVVFDTSQRRFGVIEEDGQLNFLASVTLRRP